MSRWFVYISVIVGAFFVVQRAAEGRALYLAFLEGCGAAAALMLLAALGYRLHRGDRLQSVQLPGGAGAEFERSDAVEEVRTASDDAVEALTTLVGGCLAAQHDLATRLSVVEAVIDDRRAG